LNVVFDTFANDHKRSIYEVEWDVTKRIRAYESVIWYES